MEHIKQDPMQHFFSCLEGLPYAKQSQLIDAVHALLAEAYQLRMNSLEDAIVTLSDKYNSCTA
jgi:hypothetical protein